MVAPTAADWTVVIPIHNAIAVTQRAIEYLLSSGVAPKRIQLWDDGSTDPAWKTLSEWSQGHGCLYDRSAENLGYTVTVNRAFRAGNSSYVLLLNSDCLVAHQGIEAMVGVAERYPDVAVVGPLSNNAGFQSITTSIRRRWEDLDNDEVALSTLALEQQLVSKFGRRPYVVPSVNGFCALWRQAAVREVGYFDDLNFARGYGEEDDLCFRLMRAGWFSVVAPWVFAAHFMSRSFTPAETAVLKEEALPALKARHGPAFVSSVLSNFHAHPLFRQLATQTVDG